MLWEFLNTVSMLSEEEEWHFFVEIQVKIKQTFSLFKFL